MRKKNYVGFKKGSTPNAPIKRERVLLASTPTQEEFGKIYFAFMGPFRTRRAADFTVAYGGNNPHIQTVADAERLAKEALT